MTFDKQALRTSILAACLCAAVPVATYAQAEESRTPPDRNVQPAPTEQAPATSVDEKQIEKFADAYVAVQDIQVKATEKLQTAKDAEEVQKVKTSAETEMIQAVEQNGLNVDQFNQIVQAMATDLDLRSKVNAEIQERI